MVLENIDDQHSGQLAYILAVSSDGQKQVEDESAVTENSFFYFTYKLIFMSWLQYLNTYPAFSFMILPH